MPVQTTTIGVAAGRCPDFKREDTMSQTMQAPETLELVVSPEVFEGTEGGHGLLRAALIAVGVAAIAAAVVTVLIRSRD